MHILLALIESTSQDLLHSVRCRANASMHASEHAGIQHMCVRHSAAHRWAIDARWSHGDRIPATPQSVNVNQIQTYMKTNIQHNGKPSMSPSTYTSIYIHAAADNTIPPYQSSVGGPTQDGRHEQASGAEHARRQHRQPEKGGHKQHQCRHRVLALGAGGEERTNGVVLRISRHQVGQQITHSVLLDHRTELLRTGVANLESPCVHPPNKMAPFVACSGLLA